MVLPPHALQAPPAPWQRPAPLQAGDRVRLIAPAGAFDADALAQGVALLRAEGLVPVGHPLLHARSGYYAGTDADRAEVLADALADEAACALWAVRGGSGCARLVAEVPALGPVALAERPRWLVGFSDISCLHACWGHSRTVSLHGAHLVNLPAWLPAARVDLFATLLGRRRAPSRFVGRMLTGGDGHVTGPLVGGNLTVLSSLCGTGVLPDWRGCILLLEDIDEAPYRLDRCLYQLIAAGALAHVVAVVFGQWTRCDAPAAGLYAEAMLAATLAPLALPVLAGVPVGHGADSWSVLLGAEATLDGATASLTVGP